MTASDLLALAVSASAPHEHGWITESVHSTSQGRVRYVRCSACGARRVDLEAAIDYYERAFGATVDHREVVERDGVEEALLKVAESYVQLLTPTRPDSPVAKAIEKRGEGLHHVGYRVDDCAAALASMKAAGATLIDQEPRPGSRGTTVAFVHPKGSFGTLIELVQE